MSGSSESRLSPVLGVSHEWDIFRVLQNVQRHEQRQEHWHEGRNIGAHKDTRKGARKGMRQSDVSLAIMGSRN